MGFSGSTVRIAMRTVLVGCLHTVPFPTARMFATHATILHVLDQITFGLVIIG